MGVPRPGAAEHVLHKSLRRCGPHLGSPAEEAADGGGEVPAPDLVLPLCVCGVVSALVLKQRLEALVLN